MIMLSMTLFMRMIQEIASGSLKLKSNSDFNISSAEIHQIRCTIRPLTTLRRTADMSVGIRLLIFLLSSADWMINHLISGRSLAITTPTKTLACLVTTLSYLIPMYSSRSSMRLMPRSFSLMRTISLQAFSTMVSSFQYSWSLWASR